MQMFEALEARRLMSTVATFADGSTVTQSGSGSLIVKGGSHTADNLAVVEDPNGNGETGYFLIMNNNTLEFAQVMGVNPNKPVQLIGGNGDDTLVYNSISIAGKVTGGSGNDFIILRDTRATGDSTILQDFVDGGKGDDNIGLVASPKATINGGDGNDLIQVNTGSIDNATVYDYDGAVITVNAGGGNDTIILYDGNTKVDGGGGTDLLLLAPGATGSFKNIEMTGTV